MLYWVLLIRLNSEEIFIADPLLMKNMSACGRQNLI